MCLFESLYSNRIKGMKSSIIRELLKLTQKSDIISFAGGLPAPEVFPIAEFKQSAENVLSERGPQVLQYGPTAGFTLFRQFLAENRLVKAENILVTSGSQQALDLIGKLFINPGDKIAVEAPTYVGALQAFDLYQPQYLTVPTDDFMPDYLDRILKVEKIKFVYVIPNFQNPSGNTMSLDARERLAKVAEKYGIIIIEDDPYRALRYEKENLPALVQLSPNVIYLSSFSKILAPGIRLGWVQAQTDLIDSLEKIKQATDLHTSGLTQMLVYDICKRGVLEKHIEIVCKLYKQRRDCMLEAIRRHFPLTIGCNKPEGGMFLWLNLPEKIFNIKAPILLEKALKEGVAFVHGSVFYPDSNVGLNNIRLNFSNASLKEIEIGIERLGKVIKQG